MLNEENCQKLREVYIELLKLTPIDKECDYRDKRLLEHLHLYFKRINKNPIYKNKEF